MPAGLVNLLLLRAGIERNPGPATHSSQSEKSRQGWVCSVCNLSIRANSTCVKCNACQNWCHWRPKTSKLVNCSNLTTTKKWNNNFKCSTCDATLPTATPSPAASGDSVSPAGMPAGGGGVDPPAPSSPSTPPPTPPPPPTRPPTDRRPSNNLKILQLNINGIKGKVDELADFLHTNQIKIASIQETKLSKNSKDINIPNYTFLRQDRKRNSGGGLCFFIHESVQFQALPSPLVNEQIESQIIKVNSTKIVNIYIPPSSSCTPGFEPTIAPLLPDGDAIITGDFNAHDQLWNSTLQDSRGANLAEELGTSNFGVLNNENPTRLPTNSNGQPTSPDITLASLPLLPYANWETMTQMGSDHLPIVITCAMDINFLHSDRKTFVNFKKADWQSFTNLTENEFSKLADPENIYKGEKCFRRIIKKASTKCIPQGRIKTIIPEIPAEAKEKMRIRDNLRETSPSSPQIEELSREIAACIRTHKRDKWREEISKLGSKTDSGKLFKLLKRISGQPPPKDNIGIKFRGKYISSAQEIANKFNVQYTSIVRHVSNKNTRSVTNTAHRFSLTNPTTFTPSATLEAIKKSKASKAIGPDGMSNLHLKHLGQKGLDYLTKLYNLSMSASHIPAIWKKSLVVPLPKPGKDPGDSNSYRPVSLLCPAIKILERLLLPMLNDHLTPPSFQHGFRAKHSTVSALNILNLDISAGFNKSKPADRTILLQVDLSKAFDMVSHTKLIHDLNKSTLPPGIKRWFCTYLRGRQSKVMFRNKTSKSRNVKTGVPQGAVTSPILFNYYLAKMPAPPQGLKIIQYADDVSIYASGTDIASLSAKITDYASDIVAYLEERELQISPEKSTVTLFTPDTKEAKIHPQVKIKNQIVKLDKEPKILGVYFNTMHTYTSHIKQTATKARKKANVLKALAGTDWGQDQETIINTYKATTRSVLEYGSPIWAPHIKPSLWEPLQSVQNTALRIATGSYNMAAPDHLHRETKVLPLREHSIMTSKQYLVACHLPGHPGREQLGRPPSARNLKPTLLQYNEEIDEILEPYEVLDKPSYKAAIKKVHTKTVKNTLASYPPNKVLGCAPPDIHKEATTIPREIRSTLSQLRSGYSKILNSYNHRLDDAIPDLCTKCQTGPHTTSHLFNCPANPTVLTPESLWSQPILAAHVLGLDRADPDDDDTT